MAVARQESWLSVTVVWGCFWWRVWGVRQLDRGSSLGSALAGPARSHIRAAGFGGKRGREAGVPCMQRPKEDDSTAARRHGGGSRGPEVWTYVQRRDGQSKWRSLGDLSGAGTGSRRTIRNDTTWANKCLEACPGCSGLHVGNRSIRLRVSEQGS